MIDQKSNIKILRRESYLVFLVLIFVLLIFRNHLSTTKSSDIQKDQSNSGQTISQNMAVHSAGVQIIVFSKSHVNSRGDHWDLPVRKESCTDNLITTLNISVCEDIYNELKGFSLPVFRYHLFSSEREDHHHLS